MKKITITLMAALGFLGTALSQPIASIQAPLYDGSSSSLSTPSGSASAAYHRSCWLILQSELTGFALTNSVVASWGIDFLQGVDVATVGQVTLSLQNTSDITYLKGTNWPGVLTGMGSPRYVGSFNLPVTTSFSSVVVPLTTSFTYTGGGIYVALEWNSPTAAAAQWAFSECNTTGVGLTTTGGVRGTAPSIGPAPTTLSTSAFRPAFRFNATNTATNEVGLTSMVALGQVTKWAQLGEIITATIRNNSSVALSNVTVGINITGANTFVNSKVVNSIGAGSFQTVSFDPFTAVNNGLNTMSVGIIPDQNNSNNALSWTQSVTCNIVGVTQAEPAGNFTSTCYGGGTTSGGIVALKYTTGAATSSITAVRCVVPSFTTSTFAGNAGSSVFAVLCDATGAIVTQGNPVVLSATNMDILTAFSFTAPHVLTPSTVYYLGLGTTTGTNAPFGTVAGAVTLFGHYRIPVAGGTPVLTDLEDLSITAVLSFSNTTISSAIASKTIVCKKDGPNSVTLTATGMNTYTWTPGGTGASVVVTPSVAGTATTTGYAFYSVIGTETVSGCKSNAVAITVSVSLCTGLATNNSNGYDLKLFPNPAVNGKSTITGLAGTNYITVLNTLGQVVLTQMVTEESTSIDLSNQPSGNYLVKITDSNSESRTIKVVNQN